MNLALKQWQEAFAREPVPALDRLVRGLVSLGTTGQLSLGEILSRAFAPGDAALDAAVREWLASYILQPLPVRVTPARWAALLDEFFRGIATMRLPDTGRLLRDEHSRLRLWLRGLYAGPDRDPEGSYLLALTYHQADQKFSRLWRRLVLGEEMPGRPWRELGLLGFRKLPDAGTWSAADVPVGLLQALVEWADRPGTSRDDWRHTIRSIFAAYRSTENYWVRRFREVLDTPELIEGHAANWLGGILPQWRSATAPSREDMPVRTHRVPLQESLEWVDRVARDSSLCDGEQLNQFLEQHRTYARATGHSEFLVKTFNNLASRAIRSDRHRADWAIARLEEAIDWDPSNPHNWTAYAQALWMANRRADALDALWRSRQRFAWNPVIRGELARLLREQGDLETAVAVLREAVAHFPSEVVCRNGLAETLHALGKNEDAREVYEQASHDFPANPYSRSGLAETLRALGKNEEARAVYEQACRDFPTEVSCRIGLADLLMAFDDLDVAEKLLDEARDIEPRNVYARTSLADIHFIRGARTQDTGLREKARELFQEAADDGNQFARMRLCNFDDRWTKAVARGGRLQERSDNAMSARVVHEVQPRHASEMSVAERLGRAMIAVWHAERASTERLELCAQAEGLLDVPESKLGDLLPGFVETRGLELLARGDARGALDYFTDQIKHHGRGGWLGIRLGEQRARLVLGELTDSFSEEATFDSRNARFAFRVVAVLRTLAKGHGEQEAAELLRQLYPEAARLAEQRISVTETSSASSDAATEATGMMAVSVWQRWFRPAQINSPDDLTDPSRLRRVIESISRTKLETLDVLSNATLALAA